MKVKNINATEETECKCDSWLDHWAKFSGQEPTYCPAAECMNTIAVGAHVQKDSASDSKWYILPLCHKHDAKIGESPVVNDNVELVSTDLEETCGRGRKSIGNK